MRGPPKVTGKALAKACDIRPPSVSDWLSGATKSMDGVNLIYAAEFLRVTPKWLATGLGLKFIAPYNPYPGVASNIAGYIEPAAHDPWTLEAIAILSALDDAQKGAVIARMREFVSHLGPPGNGQTLLLAR